LQHPHQRPVVRVQRAAGVAVSHEVGDVIGAQALRHSVQAILEIEKMKDSLACEPPENGLGGGTLVDANLRNRPRAGRREELDRPGVRRQVDAAVALADGGPLFRSFTKTKCHDNYLRRWSQVTPPAGSGSSRAVSDSLLSQMTIISRRHFVALTAV